MERGKIDPKENARQSLAALLQDPLEMWFIAQYIEKYDFKDLDAEKMLELFKTIHYYASLKMPAPEVMLAKEADEIEIARRTVLLRKSLTQSPPENLDNILGAILLQFQDTGYKIPTDKNYITDKNKAANSEKNIHVTGEDFANSFPIESFDIDKDGNVISHTYVIVVRTKEHKDIIVFQLGPTGQRILVAYPL